ncbi:MAG: TIM barrel protein [Promethearchaeota archaeon]
MLVGLTIQKMGPVRPSNWMKLVNLVGIDHIEFDPTVFEDIEAVLALLGNKSVTLHSPYYTHWGYDLSSKNQSEKVETFLKNVESYTEKLKAHSIVVHPPIDPQGDKEYFLENLNRIKITPLLENLPGQKWQDFEQWYLATKEQIQIKPQICFDVPHSFLTHGEDGLFDIPESLLPDLTYIHISELTSERDCHWPFGTEGGELPIGKFKDFIHQHKIELKSQSEVNIDSYRNFLRKRKIIQIINMEILPSDLKSVKNLINSYLMLLKLGSKASFIKKRLRLLVIQPIIFNKLKNVEFQSERTIYT